MIVGTTNEKNHYASSYDPKKTSAKHEYPWGKYNLPKPYIASPNYDLIVDDYFEFEDILNFCKENKIKVIYAFFEKVGVKNKMVIQLAKGRDFTFLALKYGLTS